MEKYKILIIEDDPRQIAWAKECLKEHELTFAESEEEFYKILYNPFVGMDGLVDTREKTFDFAITDLFLPIKKGESTSLEIGRGIFEGLASYQVKYNKMKGCALFSNYEHHLSDALSSFKLQYSPNIDKLNCYEIENINGEWEAKKAFAVIDMCWEQYSHFQTTTGEILTLEEIKEKGINCEKGLIGFIKEESISLLKPYQRILDCLIRSQD